jgi:hypothetical protein
MIQLQSTSKSHHLVLPLAGDNNGGNLSWLSVELSDSESLSNSHGHGLSHIGGISTRSGLDGRRLQGLGSTSKVTDLDHVDLTQAVLDEARVELDDALDAVEVGDANVKRVLDNHEGHALGARGGGQGAGVLENVGGGDLGEHVGEVDAFGDGDLGSGGGDGRHGGCERLDD